LHKWPILTLTMLDHSFADVTSSIHFFFLVIGLHLAGMYQGVNFVLFSLEWLVYLILVQKIKQIGTYFILFRILACCGNFTQILVGMFRFHYEKILLFSLLAFFLKKKSMYGSSLYFFSSTCHLIFPAPTNSSFLKYQPL
jgi:hypothetical protein